MGLNFANLEALRLLSKEILTDQVTSLDRFKFDNGFGHLSDSQKISVSSTATCVLSLVSTNSWRIGKPETKRLLKYLLSRDRSAGLEPDNPFTTAWVLEAVTALQKGFSDPLDAEDDDEVARKELVLQGEIKNGGVRMPPYPPSGYLTQLVLRALSNRGKLEPAPAEVVKEWAWSELTKQLVLIQAKSKSQDVFAVAYLLLVATALTRRATISAEQSSIQRIALKTFFDCQLKDGTWPLSRPLFHYPKFGNAYCYEYEMLTQLLQENEIRDLLLEYLPNIKCAAESASNDVYRLGPGVRAWLSGHHPQLGKPESWATASVYQFFHLLDRLLAEAVRRELFRYLELPLPNPGPRESNEAEFAKGMIDSMVHLRDQMLSLKAFLWKEFVQPISAKADDIARGIPLSESTPRSAIFFGPPGTSKTQLSKEIARFLGWWYLPIDPSLLLRNGMEGMQAEANTIFRMLEQTEGVVVLFDEFDELVRERGSSRAEQPFSRLLTTAMLPKLASIHKRGTLVFLIATNNIAEFDLAISREGRFDHVVQIMPPSYTAKLAYKKWGPDANIDIELQFRSIGVTVDSGIQRQLEDLTFAECNNYASDLMNLSTSQEAVRVLDSRWKDCTLQRRVPKTHVSNEEETTWKERCQTEQTFIR